MDVHVTLVLSVNVLICR